MGASTLIISLATVKAHISSILYKRNILLWYKKKYNPKDTSQLLGGWIRPRSFLFIVETSGVVEKGARKNGRFQFFGD